MCVFCSMWVRERERVGVRVVFVTCGCFGNVCTCIYCVLYCLYCVFVLFLLRTFILIFLSLLVYGLLPPSDN